MITQFREKVEAPLRPARAAPAISGEASCRLDSLSTLLSTCLGEIPPRLDQTLVVGIGCNAPQRQMHNK